MTENMQADFVQRRQAGFVRCCLRIYDITLKGERCGNYVPKDKMANYNRENDAVRQNEYYDRQPVRQAPKKKKKKKRNIFLFILKKLIACIAVTLLSLFLIIIITGTVVATALTVYVTGFMDDSSSITLQELEAGSTTYFYGQKLNEETGEYENAKLFELKPPDGIQRIPVEIEKVPQHVRDAFVYTEDERFYLHDGVDYKRTFTAFLNMFIHFYDSDQGGSTITQQLIKNLTGDDEKTPQRKIREIFAAMQLEKNYSKDEILEEYLNYIGFGGPRNGIEVAAIHYFGKHVEDLTIPEAAVLAAIPKSPEYYGPFVEYYDDAGNLTVDGRANNKTRQEYVLWQMYKNGGITYDEYQEYLVTDLLYTDSEEYRKLHPEVDLQEMENKQKIYTWEDDALYYEALDELQTLYNIDRDDAYDRLLRGGYKIYSTIDKKMQTYVEEKFLDINNIVRERDVRKWVDLDGDGTVEEDEALPHIAFTALRYDGSVMCTVGNWGEKKDSLVTNYACDEPRQVGSTMKPVATYGLGIESDHIHWGSVYRNSPLQHLKVDNIPWPFNYGRVAGNGSSNFIYYYLQQSFNTVPAQLVDEMSPKAVFQYCTETLGMELDPADEAHSPLALGALTYGITLENLVNAYLPYGAKGVYNEAHIISRIEDPTGQVIVDYSNGKNTRQAISAESAWVMNRLIKNVVDNGTGTNARLWNKTVIGKTGTTENWYDLAFVGMTRDFASAVTIGYKSNHPDVTLSGLNSASLWTKIIGEYANTQFPDTGVDFDPVETVITAQMCSATGMIANSYCPKGGTGYWKSTYAPYCDGNHYVAPSPSTTPSTQTPEYGPSGGDTGTGGGWVDPGTGGGWVDPGTGGGDTGTGGGTGGDVGGWVDPGTGGGDAGTGGESW